jgi:cell wall-associated NlpC family hydrolase
MHRNIVKPTRSHIIAGCLLSALVTASTVATAAETPVLNTAVTSVPGVDTASATVDGATDAATAKSAEQILREARKLAGLPGQPAAAPAAPAQALAQAQAPSSTREFLNGVASKAGEVVVGALNMIGVRYRWGGDTPDSGLDCSGFVRYVFQDTLGMNLPRRAAEMSRVGEKISARDLKPGDLVFFNTIRRTVSHVGIYIGDNKFVHSPSTGSTIRVDEMDTGYWEKRFSGARRLEISYTPAEQAQLKARMHDLVGASKDASAAN